MKWVQGRRTGILPQVSLAKVYDKKSDDMLPLVSLKLALLQKYFLVTNSTSLLAIFRNFSQKVPFLHIF